MCTSAGAGVVREGTARQLLPLRHETCFFLSNRIFAQTPEIALLPRLLLGRVTLASTLASLLLGWTAPGQLTPDHVSDHMARLLLATITSFICGPARQHGKQLIARSLRKLDFVICIHMQTML